MRRLFRLLLLLAMAAVPALAEKGDLRIEAPTESIAVGQRVTVRYFLDIGDAAPRIDTLNLSLDFDRARLALPVTTGGIACEDTTGRIRLGEDMITAEIELPVCRGLEENPVRIQALSGLNLRPTLFGGKMEIELLVLEFEAKQAGQAQVTARVEQMASSGNPPLPIGTLPRDYSGVLNIGANQTGSLQVTLTPEAAITAGAKWRVDSGAPQDSGATVSGLSTGAHTVSFDAATGFQTPADIAVQVTANQTTVRSIDYAATSCAAILSDDQIVSGDAGTTQFSVTADGAWSITQNKRGSEKRKGEAPAWATVSPANGTGNASVTVSYEQNPLTEARTLTLSLQRTDCASGTDLATLTQAGNSGGGEEYIASELLSNFAALDTDGDNGLSIDEARFLFPALAQQQFDILDVNGNALLDTAELQTSGGEGEGEGEGEGGEGEGEGEAPGGCPGLKGNVSFGSMLGDWLTYLLAIGVIAAMARTKVS